MIYLNRLSLAIIALLIFISINYTKALTPSSMQPPTPPPLQCPADSIYYSTYICPSGSTCILPDADICANTMIVQPSAILETNNSNITVLGDFVNYGTVYGLSLIHISEPTRPY